MSVEVECAACFNRGSGQGWVARTTDGTVQWLCPGCVASDSQPIPIVTSADLARLTNSQAQRAIAVCPKCGAAGPAGRCPLCQLRREARLRAGKHFAITFAIIVVMLLACGVLSGVVNDDMSRAMVAALGGALPAGLVVALAVTGYALSREGDHGRLATAGHWLLTAALLCTLFGCAVPFLIFAVSPSAPLLRTFGEAALSTVAIAATGAVLQWFATLLGVGRAKKALRTVN